MSSCCGDDGNAAALRESQRGTLYAVLAINAVMFFVIVIAAQFAISIFILAMVMIITFQNEMVLETSDAFPKSQMVVLERVGIEEIRGKHEILRQELNAVVGVQAVTFSSGVPFLGAGEIREVGTFV